MTDLGAVSVERLEQLKTVLTSTKIPIQGSEHINSKVFTEKLMEFHRSVTWLIPNNAFINESAAEEAAKKKKEEAKKKAEEEAAAKKAAEEKKSTEEQKDDAKSEEKKDEAKSEEKKDEAKAEEKKDDAKSEEKEVKPAEEKKSEEKPAAAAASDESKKDEKKDDAKSEEKKDEEKKNEEKNEENDPYPEFDDDEKEGEDSTPDISVVRKSAKFTVSFSSVQVVDLIELDFGLVRTWFEGADALKYNYSMTLEYNTAPRTWSKVWDRLPLEDIFSSSTVGRAKKSRMLQLSTAFRAQKVCFRLHVSKKSEDELESIKSTSASLIRKFSYSEDFDKNGVLYWIGSCFGKSSYTNPQASGDVAVTLSHSESSGRALELVISHTLVRESYAFGGSAPVWFTVDLGPHLALSPDYYTLRHGYSYSDSIICDWELQGSNNNETWTSLHAQLEAPFNTGWATKSWPIVSSERYRYFRVYQKGNYAYGPGQGPNGSPYLYIGGFELYGDLCSTTGVSPNVVSSMSVSCSSMTPPGLEKNREFTYSQDGDTNGVLYCIGSADGTEKWVNPARTGKVKTKVSGQSWNEADKWNCLARASDNNSSSYWGGSLPLWFWVDLGTDWKICPKYYTLRHGNNYNENFMQNWEFQGSNDCEEWTMIHSGTDSPFSYAHQLVSWPISDCKTFYRYFRILQKSNSINGPGNESGPYMYIGGFEVYGIQETASGAAHQTPSEAQKKRSLNNLFLTNKEYHLQLIKTVLADSSSMALRLKCLETLDTIIARNIHVPLYILDAIEVKTFVRLFITEGDKNASAQGGRWLHFLLSVNHKDNTFRKKLLDAILELLPSCVDTLQSAHNLDQLSNLLMSCWNADPHMSAQKCLQVLLDLGKRLENGLDQHYQILRSRFGLYEFALENDSFADPPAKKKKKVDQSNNYGGYNDAPQEEEVEDETEGADASGSGEGESADSLEAQLVQAILAYDRSKAELRTILEHITMSTQGGQSAPSPANVKDVTKAQKACVASQAQVHRCRVSLQSKFPGHSSLKNVNQNVQLDRWNVIAERLLVLITSYQHAEKKLAAAGSTRPSVMFSNDVVQDMFNLFILRGSPTLRKNMTNFLSHNVDPNSPFAVQILCRLYTDEQQASADLLPYEDIFQVLRELAMVDESAVVANSRQLFQLLSESTSGKKVDYQLSTWTLRLIGTLLKSNLAPPHHYSKCRACGTAPIRGVRYRCLQCVDYDICSKCEASHQHDVMHTLVKIPKVLPLSPSLNDAKLAARAKEPLVATSLYAACLSDPSLEVPKWPPVANVSHATMCDFCGEGINGIRYKCVNCNQYSLCQNCEGNTASYNALDSHYKGHLFCKLYHPLPPPSPNQNDAKMLVNVVLHPGLYPHPSRKDLSKKDITTAPTATAEAPASIASSSSASSSSATTAAAASPSVASPGTERAAAFTSKASPTPLMRASTGVPMARNTPSPSLTEALSSAEPEFSGMFLTTLVNTMNYAMSMQPTPSYELLLLASNCMRSLAYQYSPEDILTHLVRNSPQFMETISNVANMPYPTRVAITALLHDLCRSSTFVNMPKETAESTLKPLRAAFRAQFSKLLAAAVSGKGNSSAAAPVSAATASSSAHATTKDTAAAPTKSISAVRVQFFLGLLQGCSDTSDIVVEKKAAKVVSDWRSASAPLKDLMPSTTTTYPVDNVILGLIWNLLDEQNLAGASLSVESVNTITSSISLLLCADHANVAASASFHKFIRNTFLSKAPVHRPYWRQLYALLEKLVNASTEIANLLLNNLFTLFTETLSQPATARDMLLVTTLSLMKKKKTILHPSTADLAKLISLCITNMPEAKVLDSAVEDDHHVMEVDVLSLATTIVTAETFTAAKKSELLAQESLSFPIVTPLIAWLSSCDVWHATKKTGLGSALQAVAIRKQLVTFLHHLCEDHEGFAKRSLTGLAEAFKKNKLTSPKLVDLCVELMSNESLARHFIVDLEMGELLQSELETAEGSVTSDSSARPTMYGSTPSVPATLFSGMTSLTSTSKLLEPSDDSSAENTFRYGVPGSTSHQWCHRWQKEKENLTFSEPANRTVEYYHTLAVCFQLPQSALIREIWFDYVRQYNVAPKPPPYVIVEMGTCKEDLAYVTTYEVKPQTLLNDSNTMFETFKIPLSPAQITQCVRLTFERPQGTDSMTLGAIALLGTFNLFEEITTKETSAKGRNPSTNALNVLEHAFHYDTVRTFYGEHKGTTKLALQLLTMSTEETKSQVQTIALHLARHRPGLVSTLFSHFAKTGIPSTSSRFVGRLCAVTDDQTAERVMTLSTMVFSELEKGASSTSDRLMSLMNALSEALFVMLAAHRMVALKITEAQVVALGEATLKSFGSSLTQEACIRLLSCLIQAEPSRYDILQAKFGPKTVADVTGTDETNIGNALTMLGLLAPLTQPSADTLLKSPIMKLLLSDISEAKVSGSSAQSDSNLTRAVNFIRSVSHHPIIKEWVGSSILEDFLDILSERKFGATIQFAIQNALRTACNLSQANQDAVATYLMKVFKAASSSSSGVSDAMLQLLEDMLNINDKVMLCLHSKNETAEELQLCESSSLSSASAVMALDPDNSHNDLSLDEEEISVSGGSKSDYNWKTAIVAHPAPSNGPVSWTVTIDRSSGGNMMIGVCMKNHSHTIYIGGNSSAYKGWSYYGCTPGYKYHNGNATEYGRAFNTGDVIGVLLDQSEGTLAFTHNGEELGVAYSDLPNDEPLYPAVSLCQNSDAVKISPFSTNGTVRASGIDNKHPLFYQRSNRVAPIALATPLSTVAEGLLAGRADRKVVFTRYPKSNDEKDSPALKEELPYTTSLRELLDPSTEVLDVSFSLVPVAAEKKDKKKDEKDKKKDVKKEGEEDAEAKKEKEKEKAELAARKAELEAKKKADQTGVMKRFASQKGLEMLVTVLSQRLNGSASASSASPAAAATTTTSSDDKKDNDDAAASAKPADDDADVSDAKKTKKKKKPAKDPYDTSSDTGSDTGSDDGSADHEDKDVTDLGILFGGDDAGFTDFAAPAPPAPKSEKKKGKKEEKKKKGFVSKATWAKWVKLLSDCLIIDGVVDSFVQDEDCRAMLFAAIEAAKTTGPADSGSLEPLPQPSKSALEAPLIPLYRMLLSTLSAADVAKSSVYREQLLKCGLLKACLVEMMDLCDVMPVSTESEHFKTEAAALQADRDEKAAAKKKANSGTSYWAKGTGYGTNSDEKNDFNLTAYVRETVLTGKKVTQLLEVVAFMLAGVTLVPTGAEMPAFQKEINEVILASPLRPVLESYLRNDSLLEMSRSLALYQVLFRIAQLLTTQDNFLPLIIPEDSSSNVYTLMEHLQRIAALVQKMPATSEKRLKEKEGAEGGDSTAQKKKKKSQPKPSSGEDSTPSASGDGADVKDVDGADEPNEESEKVLASEIQKTFEMLKEKAHQRREEAKSKAREAAEKDTTLSKVDKLIDVYCTTLRDLQFGDVDMLEKGKDDEYSHHYKSRIKSDTAPGSKKMKRLVQELAVLSTSLPLHPDSSVFLRVDEQRIDICKVLITGPDKTPYESGAFQFDMYLDSDYPKGSPKINLMTTGHGSVRFNPNLYNCGKVCLSLLGTWPGGANEEWNEETSTILQLIISIQSLIFVPEPYFNEPGYESTMNSDTGRTQSRQYNENIRIQTVRWAMIDQLKNPSPGFEEVIKTHFKLKKDIILEQLDNWMAEFVAHSDDSHQKEFEKLVQECQRLLNAL